MVLPLLDRRWISVARRDPPPPFPLQGLQLGPAVVQFLLQTTLFCLRREKRKSKAKTGSRPIALSRDLGGGILGDLTAAFGICCSL